MILNNIKACYIMNDGIRQCKGNILDTYNHAGNAQLARDGQGPGPGRLAWPEPDLGQLAWGA